jgi:thioredoxin reductase
MSGNVLMAASGGGPDWAALGIVALERVGILGDGAAARNAGGVFVAGDALADRPRTVLECVRAGIEAATLAARRG